MSPLDKLLAPYRNAVQGTPTTEASMARDPVYESLLQASQSPSPNLSASHSSSEPGLEPLLQKLLNRLPWLDITSGFRTEAEQAALYAAKPDLAAPPGHSFHEVGGAIDVHSEDIGRLLQWLGNHPKFGNNIYRPMTWEPWHFQLEGDRGDYQ